MLISIGAFNISSGKIRVTDPCYTKDTWCSGVLENCRTGIWKAYVEEQDEDNWGKRIAELIIEFESEKLSKILDWEKVDIIVGVDSGQAPGEYFDSKSFYHKVCKLTSEKETEHQSGVIDFGVVSSSGFGDGSYNCYVKKNKLGEIIASRIVFIEDEYN